MENCEKNDKSSESLQDAKGYTYSHALKMRAAASWGFAHHMDCGHQEWRQMRNGEYEGNPSLSYEVGKYMISLQRRKVYNQSYSFFLKFRKILTYYL